MFYPSANPLISLSLTFLTFALGFLTRPLGAFIFGHYGDRVGRKNSLILTLLLSGISTGLIGILPSYDSVGFLAVVLLVILRLLLGIGLGGEWGGALILLLETYRRRRGLYATFVQSTVGIGLLLANLLFLIVTISYTQQQILDFGWRIPFLVSFLLVILGLLMRFRIPETPLFEQAKLAGKIQKIPSSTVFRKYWFRILLGTLIAGSVGNFFYYGATFIPNIFATLKIITTQDALIGSTLLAIMDIVFVFVSGYLADVTGRKIVLIIANVIALIILYPAIIFVSNTMFLVFVALLGIAHGLAYTALGAMLTELFPTEVRYTGTSLSYQFGNSFIAGLAPYVGSVLGGINYLLYPVFTLISIIVALISIYIAPETRELDLGEIK
ncbi:MAG: MFS transporter [Ignisphaera sp.]